MNIPGKYIRIILAVLAGLLLTGGVVRVRAVETKVQETQEHMADEVLRFHVLANSDTKEDQNLKMKVKDQVIGYLEETMGPETESLDETKEFVKAHIPEIEKEAKKIVEQEGYSYPVKVRLEKTDFPEKTYGDVTFPAGTYEALRIEIGNGDGKNWWCVLYPNLCFIDTVHAVVPEKGKEKLQNVLTDDEYDMVTATSRFRIRWFFFGDRKDE
ncbi:MULTISPECIES: stage II sporulation protein R [Sellimonas]|uniref:Stage II sporulation protein R n=1 Tax=Sellimonas caecigallum TaxID=2592333 RepID=A0ABS7L5H4_9FIRM|nr:stage II sporulation protein R [Sellimonas caecigallum]MBY0758274.1 stage II sporulation protein R [Sellimonas caecigallum]OUP01630.1 stage II sporulation protein R [Drancourtella sp. An210]OUP62713.1 stage II sporulation protein R [Drancourtella sp. An177]